ncbi:MAG: PDZ domain-containing protein [Betaproteobacteria bacterium]
MIGGCALPAAPQPLAEPPPQESPLPGTIGVVVRPAPGGVAVAGVRAGIAALREGDLIVRYNGAPVRTVREFNRMVVDSPPGSVAELELLRGGERRRVQVPVYQLNTMPRG